MATPRGTAYLATPFASPSTRVIASPFQFATTEDDNLQIVSANSQTGVVLAIQGRRLSPKGDIEPFAFVHVPNTDRSTKTENYKLGAGALLNLTIFALSGSPRIGQTYVSARMIRGLSGPVIILGALLGGYVTSAQVLAYPGSPIADSISGGGYTRLITGTDPAAGSDAVETVPTGVRWRLRSHQVLFTATAAAGDRKVALRLESGASLISISTLPGTIPPSGAAFCQWAPPMPLSTQIHASTLYAGIPDAVLLAGHTITARVIQNGAAGDNFDAPVLTVDEWLEVTA